MVKVCKTDAGCPLGVGLIIEPGTYLYSSKCTIGKMLALEVIILRQLSKCTHYMKSSTTSIGLTIQ
jgi:hypothetical protein